MGRAAFKNDFMTTYMGTAGRGQSGLVEETTALWLVDVNAAEQALWAMEAQTPRLCWRERMEFETTSNWRRGRDRYAAHVALRLILERWLGAQAVRGVAFDYYDSGKPYLRDSGLDFSLSYSDQMVLIGVRVGGAIGVDLECERTVKMSAERQAQIAATASAICRCSNTADSVHKDVPFLQAWTRMEAVSKATGMGIGRVLRYFGLTGADKAHRAGDQTAVIEFIERYDVCVRDLDIFPGLYASVAQIRGTVMPQLRNMPVERDDLEDFTSDDLQRR